MTLKKSGQHWRDDTSKLRALGFWVSSDWQNRARREASFGLGSHFILSHFLTEENRVLFWLTVFTFGHQKLLFLLLGWDICTESITEARPHLFAHYQRNCADIWYVIEVPVLWFSVFCTHTRLCVWWASWWESAGTPTPLHDWPPCASRKPCLSYLSPRTSKNSSIGCPADQHWCWRWCKTVARVADVSYCPVWDGAAPSGSFIVSSLVPTCRRSRLWELCT